MLKDLNKKEGFSLIEVIISVLVISIASAGIYTTVTALRTPAIESSQEVSATHLARKVLDRLRMNVDADIWVDANGNLAVWGNGTPHPWGTIELDNGMEYDVTYDVTADPNSQGRFVTVTVTW